MKIIEWNINHRDGYSGQSMPEWVKIVVQNQKADIIILTETSFKVPNWHVEYCKLVNREEYYVFCSNNSQVGNNEVVMAIKKDIFDIEYVKSFFAKDHTYPDHLEVHCIHKETKIRLTIVGMRIHSNKISDIEKQQEFKKVLEFLEKDENAIIAGDFNNYRRSYSSTDCAWCLGKAKSLAEENNFKMFTPSGSSIYQDNKGDDSFPEDHIFVKGNNIKMNKLYPYDRTFVENDTNIYKWGKDFQLYKGKDKNGKNLYDSISDPFPDHAIIKMDFTIE